MQNDAIDHDIDIYLTVSCANDGFVNEYFIIGSHIFGARDTCSWITNNGIDSGGITGSCITGSCLIDSCEVFSPISGARCTSRSIICKSVTADALMKAAVLAMVFASAKLPSVSVLLAAQLQALYQ